MGSKKIRSESEFKVWFKNNFRKLGYTKIIKDNKGKFPDFIMLKNKKRVGVELETLSSNFILHKHNPRKVNEVVCVKRDISLGIPTREVKELHYESRVKRVSATIEKETLNFIEILVKSGRYRNKSHVIEDAIKLLEKREKKK